MSTNPKDLDPLKRAQLRRNNSDPGIARLPKRVSRGALDGKAAEINTDGKAAGAGASETYASDIKGAEVRADHTEESLSAKNKALETEVARLKELLSKNTRRLRDTIYRLEAEGDVRWCEDCDTVYSVTDTCRCEDEDFPGLSVSEQNS